MSTAHQEYFFTVLKICDMSGQFVFFGCGNWYISKVPYLWTGLQDFYFVMFHFQWSTFRDSWSLLQNFMYQVEWGQVSNDCSFCVKAVFNCFAGHCTTQARNISILNAKFLLSSFFSLLKINYNFIAMA